MNDDGYIVELPNWKDVPIRFSDLDAKTIKKVIVVCWEYYKFEKANKEGTER